jgi:hypothetical protein
MKWVSVPNKNNYLVMHREDEAMTIRIYPDPRLSPSFKGVRPLFIQRGDAFVELKSDDTNKIEFHISYYNKETGDKLKKSLASNGLSDQKLAYITVSNHSDENGLYITMYKEFAWLKFNSIITVIESLDENGKDSLLGAREYLKDKVPIPQPLPLRSQALRTVQKEIDKGNRVMEDSSKKHLPTDLKEHIRFTDDKILRSYQRFEAVINDNRNLHLEHPGMIPEPIYFAKLYIQDIESRDPSSKYLSEMKKMFKEKFKIDYEKSILTEIPANPDPPKDKGGGTPGCSVM